MLQLKAFFGNGKIKRSEVRIAGRPILFGRFGTIKLSSVPRSKEFFVMRNVLDYEYYNKRARFEF